jgi:hypothetical protein
LALTKDAAPKVEEGTLDATTSTGLLVWRRDLEPASRTWVNWIIIGMAALCGFGAFAAYMADDSQSIGTFIGLGVIVCGLVWLIPRIFDWGRRRNPEIRMEGRELCWAKVRVPIDQVDTWGAGIATQTIYNGTTRSRSSSGVVDFTMFDGENTSFHFPHLGENELSELIAAIDPILPGRRRID